MSKTRPGEYEQAVIYLDGFDEIKPIPVPEPITPADADVIPAGVGYEQGPGESLAGKLTPDVD